MPCPPVPMSRPLTVGILVASDTASGDGSTDRAGPALKALFAESSDTWTVADLKIVPDDVEAIQSQVKKWTDEEMLNLVVTTGGTGFAIRDITPEALTPLLEKTAPGIVHAMLATSFQITPYAAMARPVAGVRGCTMVIAVPGSLKAAKENVEAVLKLLPHACDLTAGANSRKLHSERGVAESGKGVVMTDSARVQGHSHDHHHHHGHGGHGGVKPRTTEEQRKLLSNQLGGKVTQRHRSSPYPMISVKEANEKILENTHVLPITTRPVDEDLVGYILAEDIKAAESVPAFRASIVDGYAVISSDGEGKYPVTYISHASPASPQSLKSGQIARITTGAPVPDGADAVIMVEDTIIASETADGEENEVQLLASVPAGENIREVGSDVKKGDAILRKGTEISFAGGEVGVLASVGIASVKVFERPVVGVLSTGNELVRHTEERELRMGEVRDSNRPSLLTTLQAWGYKGVDLGIASDTPGSLETVMKKALEKVDVIITTGGVSMGELDLLKPTIERSLNGTIHFGRVAMKPGKPTTFATIPSTTPKQIFALPGNPASALVTFHLFVLPALRKASGVEPPALPIAPVVVQQDINLDPRPEYHRVFISVDANGKLLAESTGFQRSSRVGSLSGANGLLCLPSSKDRKSASIEKGELVNAIVLGRLGGP